MVSGHMCYPLSIFVQGNLPYHFNRTSTLNLIQPFAHTNYMYYSFVPSVISSWNNLVESQSSTSGVYLRVVQSVWFIQAPSVHS